MTTFAERLKNAMTSQERHEARFQRRKAKRLERKQARCDSLGPMNKVFSYRRSLHQVQGHSSGERRYRK